MAHHSAIKKAKESKYKTAKIKDYAASNGYYSRKKADPETFYLNCLSNSRALNFFRAPVINNI